MADSLLVQERGSHWSGGDGVPSRCSSWSWHPSSQKGHPPFSPLSQLTDCHSQISFSAPTVSVVTPSIVTFKDTGENCFFPLHLDSKNTVRLFRRREMSDLVFQRCTSYLEEFLFFFSVEVLRRHMHKKFSSTRGQEKAMENPVSSTLEFFYFPVNGESYNQPCHSHLIINWFRGFRGQFLCYNY